MTEEGKKAISNIILNCDAEDLRTITNLIGFRRNMLEDELKAYIKVGDTVDVHGNKVNETGTVIEVKRTKAIVEIDGKRWNCPLSMLTLNKKNNE